MPLYIEVLIFFTILKIIDQVDTLVELPKVNNNDDAIKNTELTIRAIAYKLFTTIKLKYDRDNTKLNKYRLIHNYFVSQTLKDNSYLKDVVRFTRISNKALSNYSSYFSKTINEIWSEDNLFFQFKQNKTINNILDIKVEQYIDDFLRKTTYLKTIYGDNDPHIDMAKNTKATLKNNKHHLDKPSERLQENSSSDYDAFLNENNFWVPSPRSRRIHGGYVTNITEFPFVASIHYYDTFLCGGTIIGDDVILTAASCLHKPWAERKRREHPKNSTRTISFLSVRVGSSRYHEGGTLMEVYKVYIHPTYNARILKNNLAILRLESEVPFTHKKISRIKKIRIDRVPYIYPSGVTIIGWGERSGGDMLTESWFRRLSYADLDVYPSADCMDIYRGYVNVNNFCAGFSSSGVGACEHDIGGPGITDGVLSGVISFGGPLCGAVDNPTVLTKVAAHAGWIDDVLDGRYRPERNSDDIIIQEVPRNSTRINYMGALKTFLKIIFNEEEVNKFFDVLNDRELEPIERANMEGDKEYIRISNAVSNNNDDILDTFQGNKPTNYTNEMVIDDKVEKPFDHELEKNINSGNITEKNTEPVQSDDNILDKNKDNGLL